MLSTHLKQVQTNRHLALIRKVATTSSSKTNQFAQQQEQRRLQNNAGESSLSQSFARRKRESNGKTNDETKFRARMNNLPLWQSVDVIKRLGHRLAKLDPLELRQPEQLNSIAWSYPLIEQMRANNEIVATQGFLDTNQPLMAVNELIDAVWNIYVDSECGIELEHMSNVEEVEWITSQWENLNESFHPDPVNQQTLGKLLLETEAFDHFMALKFPTVKRYGCEGVESMLVVFDEILRLCHLGAREQDDLTSSIGQIDDVIIGMPHRGRLNLLSCLLGVDPAVVFNRAAGEPELDLREAWMATGDVLSHLSTNTRFVYGLDRQHIGLCRDTPQPINVSLLPNPSHLEIVSPMVAGVARGRAHNIYNNYSSSPKFPHLTKHKTNEPAAKFKENAAEYWQLFETILPVQVHGDASIAGQGIVQETLQMANLPHFSVGGSIHLVVNNQIGYTTEGAISGRSSRYCTDTLKLIEAPIIHVNAQNIASVIRATRLALTYRQRFGKDIAIDLVGFRRHGHNEMDEPAYTQPLMYSAIRSRKSIPQLYCDEIGLSEEKRKQIVDQFKERLKDAHQRARSSTFKPDNDNYRNFNLPSEFHRDHICTWNTGCDLNLLRQVALDSVKTPQDFTIHPNLARTIVAERQKRYSTSDGEQLAKTPVDWATAEMMAFGSLLKQNQPIRLSGQDVGRSTFSVRHSVLYDQKNNKPYAPLNNLDPSDTLNSSLTNSKQPPARIEIADSILSESAVLAYEFGYSIETCNLTLWEAQFGDFFNGAQSVIDTLVSSTEAKWLRQTPLTLLLPHGLDGAGPEHSSARLERFLQMSSSSMDSVDTEAKVNWSVCFPTMPSQYFHLLRRQVMRPFRKPLVVMSPKTLFRHPDCVSALADFGPDRTFEPVLSDPCIKDPSSVNTIVLCAGKVYFQLQEMKNKNGMSNIALIRIEELCPFPVQALLQSIKQYPNADLDNLVWFQEEHKNQGAYSFVDTRMRNIAGINLRYIGRPESELPATGSGTLHKKELEQISRDFRSLGNNS